MYVNVRPVVAPNNNNDSNKPPLNQRTPATVLPIDPPIHNTKPKDKR